MTRSRAFGFAFTFASLAATLSLAGAASAQGPAAPAPVVAPAPVADQTASAPEDNYKHMTLVANPLSAIVGRYGVDFSYLPALHHALVLNPFYQHVSADVTTNVNGVESKSSSTFGGFGGEVGYRYYTGEKGANGFYVGPSFIFGSYAQTNSAGDKVSFSSIGAAIDIGGQAIIGDGFTIGGGFGLQYTKTSTKFEDLPFGAAVLAGGGVRPRFLFTIGYSFS